MAAGVVPVMAASHDLPGLSHGALSGGQEGAHQQQLSFGPGGFAEQRCKGHENGYHGMGQGEHDGAFRGKLGQSAYPAFIRFLNFT